MKRHPGLFRGTESRVDKRIWIVFLFISFSISIVLSIGIVKIVGKKHSTSNNEKKCWDTVQSGALYFSSKQYINIGRPIPNTNFSRVIVSPAVIYLLQLMMVVKKTDFIKDSSKLKNHVDPSKTRPAANLVYKASTTETGLQWKKPHFGIGSFTMMDMRYFNNSLRVPDSGWYLVYSVFTLRTASPNEILKHRINRKSDNNVSLLLENTIHGYSSPLSIQSSLLWNRVHLKRDDYVSPYISNPASIYPFSVTNFWGAFKMNDPM